MPTDTFSAPKDARLCVIGLGYVGMPLAVAFGRAHPTVGFDIDHKRVAELRAGSDHTLEVTRDEIMAASLLTFSFDAEDLVD